jgi:hypothetical protein
MIQNETVFTWTAQRERAALLLAEDELSDEKIAEACGVKRVTLHRWKQHPEFAERIADHVQALEAEMLKFSIAKRRTRIAALEDRWERMQRIITERAVNEDLGVYYHERNAETQEVTAVRIAPGWTTGLLVRKETKDTIEFKVDTGLLNELRAHEEQAAKELGQWTEKKDLTSGGEIIKAYVGIDLDKV